MTQDARDPEQESLPSSAADTDSAATPSSKEEEIVRNEDLAAAFLRETEVVEEAVENGKKIRRKGIYLLPNLFTTGGLFSGFFAIIAASQGRFTAACVAIFVAALMALLRAIRAHGPTSKTAVIMLTGPTPATKKVLDRAGRTVMSQQAVTLVNVDTTADADAVAALSGSGA